MITTPDGAIRSLRASLSACRSMAVLEETVARSPPAGRAGGDGRFVPCEQPSTRAPARVPKALRDQHGLRRWPGSGAPGPRRAVGGRAGAHADAPGSGAAGVRAVRSTPSSPRSRRPSARASWNRPAAVIAVDSSVRSPARLGHEHHDRCACRTLARASSWRHARSRPIPRRPGARAAPRAGGDRRASRVVGVPTRLTGAVGGAGAGAARAPASVGLPAAPHGRSSPRRPSARRRM